MSTAVPPSVFDKNINIHKRCTQWNTYDNIIGLIQKTKTNSIFLHYLFRQRTKTKRVNTATQRVRNGTHHNSLYLSPS